MKLCSRCQEPKPRADFYKRHNGNPHSYCKACQKAVNMSNRRKRLALS